MSENIYYGFNLNFNIRKGRKLNIHHEEILILEKEEVICYLKSREKEKNISETNSLFIKCKPFNNEMEALIFSNNIRTRLNYFGFKYDSAIKYYKSNLHLGESLKDQGSIHVLNDLNIYKIGEEQLYADVLLEGDKSYDNDLKFLKKSLELNSIKSEHYELFEDTVHELNELVTIGHSKSKFISMVYILERFLVLLKDGEALRNQNEINIINDLISNIKDMDESTELKSSIINGLSKIKKKSIRKQLYLLFMKLNNTQYIKDVNVNKLSKDVYNLRSAIVHGRVLNQEQKELLVSLTIQLLTIIKGLIDEVILKLTKGE